MNPTLLILTAGLDLYRRLHLAAPAGWPLTTPHDVLLSNADRIGWSDQGWWWPAVIAGLVLAAVLALLWLLAQLRRRRPASVHLRGTPPPESVELRGRALSNAVTAEARALPGVEQASAHVTGRAARPCLHVALTLTDHDTPAPVLQALCHGPVAHAHAAPVAVHTVHTVRQNPSGITPTKARVTPDGVAFDVLGFSRTARRLMEGTAYCPRIDDETRRQ